MGFKLGIFFAFVIVVLVLLSLDKIKKFGKDVSNIPKKIHKFSSLGDQIESFKVDTFIPLPVSLSEPEYAPYKWNEDKKIMNNHNCYSYFLDDFNTDRKGKPQPE